MKIFVQLFISYFVELVLSEITSRSDTKPMKMDEVRKFKIDKNKKKECKLPGEGVIEVEIKKQKTKHANFEFILVKKSFLEKEVNLLCDDGYIVKLSTRGKAENCGIGRIFTELCMNEKKLHKTKNTAKNKAIREIEKYIEYSEERLLDEEIVKKLRNLKDWSTSYCSKLMYLTMIADPKSGAHVYFKSAIASGFTEMFMLSDVLFEEELEFYPNEGPCAVKELQGRYSDDGYMVDGNKNTDVVGWNWFFCLPKKPDTTEKCTIL